MKTQQPPPQNDADFMIKDPMVTQKVAAKADRSRDPFEYIDELRQDALNAEGRDYRIWNQVKAINVSLQLMDQRLGDTGLNKAIDERMLGNVKTTASKLGAVFLRRFLIASGTIVAAACATGIGWVVKMVWIGIHAK